MNIGSLLAPAKRLGLAGVLGGCVVLAGGCAMRDSRLSDRPWNRPTREELSGGWWLRDAVPNATIQSERFLDHYP